ncbi:MAG: acylase [Gammaproteobacteria bacterium]|nr:acylase [Gammaproteobacteria bacterium]
MLSKQSVTTLLLILILALSGCDRQPVDPEIARLQERAEAVTIIRDDFGVPHIYAKTDADAVFGMLYAQSEDDFNRVERNYIWAIGRLAEVDGEAALYSDLRARLYMTVDEAKAAYESAPEWLRALCDAFADGVNYYLHTHPEVTPRLLTRFEPWMPMYFSEGSIGGDIEQIPLSGIEAFYGGDPAPVARSTRQPGESALAEPVGSNGFAIAGKLTKSGNAMLLINPHTSLFFRGEIHVVSEQGLNAYGAVTWGQFFVYQGFNENTGWMHTSTRVDFMDEFVEDVFEEDGKLLYRYGDERRAVQVSSVTLKYKLGDGMSERTFPTYRTHHGPITHEIDGKWVATKINWDPARALEQSFVRTKLRNHDEFRQMMGIRTNSSNNTVYADSSGNIAYYHGNFVPRRDPALDYSKPVDGSDPATDWQGLHPVDEIITILNSPNGWIQNCNSTPYTAAAEFSPRREDYAPYMATAPENFRGVHATRLLSELSGGLTLEGLIEMAYDTYLPGFETLLPGLVAAYDQAGQEGGAIGEAIEALRTWDRRIAGDSVAMTLAHFYGASYLKRGELPENMAGAARMDRINYFGSGSPHKERLDIFTDVVAKLETDFGRWDVPWSEVNRYQRLNGDITQAFDDDAPSLPVGNMASSYWGSLAAYGARGTQNTRRIYGTRGNSFVAVVEFGDKVRAKTLLAGGQSGDPGSPHFDDQATRYVEGAFKEAAYYREDVLRRAQRSYHPGQ